jgi:hypothetical protein
LLIKLIIKEIEIKGVEVIQELDLMPFDILNKYFKVIFMFPLLLAPNSKIYKIK